MSEHERNDEPGRDDGSVLSVEEIYSKYADEWVLIEALVTREGPELLGGRVVSHSKDRDEVYRQAILRRPPRFAVYFTGTIPADSEFIL